MLHFHSAHRLDQIEAALRRAAERYRGSLVATGLVGEAVGFTVCLSDLSAPLLRADIRFSTFLPCRISAWAQGDGVILESISPRDYCRLLHRPELEPLLEPLEETLRLVLDEAAHGHHASATAREHLATEEQVNMRAALPQRVDCHGTKVEELGGTGVHDAQGG
jgi:Domain of unknown function DUF302